MKRPCILVIDEDDSITEAIIVTLEDDYEVETASNGMEGLQKVKDLSPSLVLLELTLPDIEGIEACRRLRLNSNVPVIIITTRDEIDSKLEGLRAGADDYLIKPFHLQELRARVEAQLRRTPPQVEPIKLGNLEIDPVLKVAKLKGVPIDLTGQEWRLLDFLTRNQDRLISRQELVKAVWGEERASNSLEVLASRLRKKFGENKLLYNVHGRGYVFSQHPEEAIKSKV